MSSSCLHILVVSCNSTCHCDLTLFVSTTIIPKSRSIMKFLDSHNVPPVLLCVYSQINTEALAETFTNNSSAAIMLG